MSRWDATRARLEADHCGGGGPDAVPAVPAGGGAALVYLITHPKLGAAKVGIADTSGLRLAQHRRAGWQVAAVFSVAAGRAAAVEAAMLEGWRRAGMPSYLAQGQMPQGGWTETVALGRLDLAAEVTRLCKLAVQQDARPSRSRSGASLRLRETAARKAARLGSCWRPRWPTGPRPSRGGALGLSPAAPGDLGDLRRGVRRLGPISSASSS